MVIIRTGNNPNQTTMITNPPPPPPPGQPFQQAHITGADPTMPTYASYGQPYPQHGMPPPAYTDNSGMIMYKP